MPNNSGITVFFPETVREHLHSSSKKAIENQVILKKLAGKKLNALTRDLKKYIEEKKINEPQKKINAESLLKKINTLKLEELDLIVKDIKETLNNKDNDNTIFKCRTLPSFFSSSKLKYFYFRFRDILTELKNQEKHKKPRSNTQLLAKKIISCKDFSVAASHP